MAIYVIKNKHSGAVMRYVRANTLNGAARAYSTELFHISRASSEDMFKAFKDGFDVLDTVDEPVQVDIEDVIKGTVERHANE